MLPLSVIRFRLEAIPGFAGCTKQKLPTTSTTQNSLSPVAASMIFSVAGTSIRVVYFQLGVNGTMSCEWTWTVRAAGSRATAAHVAITIRAVKRSGQVTRDGSFGVGVSDAGRRARPERKIVSESAQTFRDTKTRKVFALGEVVAGVVGRHPVRDRIDVQLHFLRAMCLTDQHLTWGNQAGDEFKFCVVQMKCFAVEFSSQLTPNRRVSNRVQPSPDSALAWSHQLRLALPNCRKSGSGVDEI